MTASRRVIKFSIGQHIGRYISGIAMPDGGVDWSFARKLGLGLWLTVLSPIAGVDC